MINVPGMPDGMISIHALRGEGDLISKHLYICVARISIHALRGEGDDNRDKDRERRQNFNPRPPWGGRQCRQCDNRDKDRISIHALRGEGDEKDTAYKNISNISIHALRGEGDMTGRVNEPTAIYISIHALRGEGDYTTYINYEKGKHFNPRPPWGGRLPKTSHSHSCAPFQSTPSVGRATAISQVCLSTCAISIHALRGEGDVEAFLNAPTTRKFQSTPSVGRATTRSRKTSKIKKISIHALRGEGDPLRRLART